MPLMRYSIDPALAATAADWPVLDLRDVVAARAVEARLTAKRPAPDLTNVECSMDRAHVGDDRRPVDVRVYSPTSRSSSTPAVLDVHGGGFVLGSAENSHAHNVRIVRELGVVVVSVEYRLAPEDPFPAAIEDCYTALLWLVANATELGVDRNRIALTGVSAGAGIAAGLALLARDRGGPAIRFQYLGIPALDDRMATGSMLAFDDTPGWNSQQARMSWDCYLGVGVAGTDAVEIYAAPARAVDVSRLPATYVSAMQFDPLRDEAVLYASRLLAAGVSTELHVFPGTFHGSATVESAVSRYDNSERVEVLRRALF
jgi:acetyl esterase